jgi:membrane protein
MNTLKARLAAFQRSRPGQFVKKVLDDQMPNLAALLAWGTLSAILPLLLGLLALAGLVLRDQQRLDQVYNSISGVLPAAAAEPITSVLEGMRQSAASVGIIAIVLLLVNGSGFFTNMASVFNQAYHVQGRNFVLERLIALGMLILTAAMLIMSTLAAGLSSLVSKVPGVVPVGPVLGQIVGWLVSIASVFILFLLIYRVLPNARQTWHSVVPGALMSSVLLIVLTQVFPLYVALFPPNHAYAFFGVFLVLTFWLYLLGLVLVLGAELNAFLWEPTWEPARTAEPAAEARRALPSPRPSQTTARPHSAEAQPRPQSGLGGRLVGIAGLLLAAMLLRGEVKASDERATV